MNPPARHVIGTWHGLVLDVVAWDSVGAAVDLSCAGMFAHEVGGAPLAGGLLDLDDALDGGLVKLRLDGLFGGARGETLLLDTPPGRIIAPALLLIGLGDPDDWDIAVMAGAVRAGVGEAIRRGAASAGIAPGLLDSGLMPAQTRGTTGPMLRGVLDTIEAAHHLADRGLASRPRLERWSFAAGAAHLEVAAAAYRAEFSNLT